MRILYLDIDSLRPDHLGCYGYHRDTSPNIDRIAKQGVRLNHCHATDVPCLPSRTALFAGRFGIHTGVIDHGGVAAQPFVEGPGRSFRDRFGQTSLPAMIRKAGLRTTIISPFGERHSAWHWYAGFNEVHNSGGGGMEGANQVSSIATEWIERNASDDNWLLHINVWDPHTPYRAPQEFIDKFKDQPLPAWYTEEVRQQHWEGIGPHSAQEVNGFAPVPWITDRFPNQPAKIDSMDEARRMFDGYDAGVAFADHHVGEILKALEKQGVLDDVAIMISADHGENLGELNIYGDHQTADEITTHIPMILRIPGVTDDQAGRVDEDLHYHIDVAATLVELAGQEVPEVWDGRSFAPALREGRDDGREFLVVSQGAWSCQRGVRFVAEGKQWLMLRSYHDGYHGLPDVMLFNLTDDPHEQHDLAPKREDLVGKAMVMLDQWYGDAMRTATHGQDPMWTVMNAGGAFHTRGQLPEYLERLRATGRAGWADHLEKQHALDLRRD